MIEIKGILGMIGIASLMLYAIFQGVDKLMEKEAKKNRKKKWYE